MSTLSSNAHPIAADAPAAPASARAQQRERIPGPAAQLAAAEDAIAAMYGTPLNSTAVGSSGPMLAYSARAAQKSQSQPAKRGATASEAGGRVIKLGKPAQQQQQQHGEPGDLTVATDRGRSPPRSAAAPSVMVTGAGLGGMGAHTAAHSAAALATAKQAARHVLVVPSPQQPVQQQQQQQQRFSLMPKRRVGESGLEVTVMGTHVGKPPASSKSGDAGAANSNK